TAHELLAACTSPDGASRPPRDVVRAYWQRQHPGGDFETLWRRALHDGVVPGTGGSAMKVVARTAAPIPPFEAEAAGADTLEITFRPDPKVLDGRFANNAWLQELPHPMTKITWDNAACLAPVTAERLRVRTEDVVEIRVGDRAVRAPVWVMPGHAP